MVQVTSYQERTSSEGEVYYALELQSDQLEFVVSQNTGRHYATVKKCWMSCTFNESVCKMMIGKEMQGSVEKQECDPYTFTIKGEDGEAGEEVTRTFRYAYVPIEESSMEEVVIDSTFQEEPA